MKYELISANNDDITYLKETKLYNIFSYANNLKEEERTRINKYIDKHIPMEISNYKIIMCNNKRVGCFSVKKENDGVILDEIYLEEDYRNKGIGTNIIKSIIRDNKVVYLWVYIENIKAISLYEKLGFNIIKEKESRYYMKYSK